MSDWFLVSSDSALLNSAPKDEHSPRQNEMRHRLNALKAGSSHTAQPQDAESTAARGELVWSAVAAAQYCSRQRTTAAHYCCFGACD